MNFFKNSAVRAILYIVIFAGLLKLSGMLVAWLWNKFLLKLGNFEPITFLESVGVVTFGYLIFAGIRFGFASFDAKSFQMGTPGKMPECEECARLAQQNGITTLRSLNKEEKERLKEAIAKCCGMQQSHQTNGKTQHANLTYQKSAIKESEF